MAYDAEQHTFDPKTGFMIDKETGVQVGLVGRPPVPVRLDTDYPAWVVPHDSHIQRKEVAGMPANISAPGFRESHVNRVTNEVTVLVSDEEEAKRAISPFGASAEPVAVHPYESAALEDSKATEHHEEH